LQGCGGGTTTTTTTTTTTATPKRSKPMSSAEAAAYLNELFLGFDETNKTSPLGVTISMAAQPATFFGNIFCSDFASNPLGKTKCHEGQADCRLSASLYSHKWFYHPDSNKTMLGLGRSTGFAFNQSMVEKKWAKCSYIWDGASGNKYNNGCGDGAPGHNCDKDSGSAFYNICPSTGKTCTGKDIEVTRAKCQPYGGEHPVPPTHGGQPQCFFPGPALDYHQQSDFTPGEDKMRDMAVDRVKYNGGKDTEGPNIEKWNEVVLDEHLLLPDMWYDPAPVLVAFLYTASQKPISLKNAQAMRDEFGDFYGVKDIPLVEVDDNGDKESGPFKATTEDESVMVV